MAVLFSLMYALIVIKLPFKKKSCYFKPSSSSVKDVRNLSKLYMEEIKTFGQVK